MKTVHEFRSGRTIIAFGAMFAWAWASQEARGQNLDCSNGCGAYAEYALVQRLHLPASIQNMPREKIATWFSRHPQYSSRLNALAAECQSSCAKCGIGHARERAKGRALTLAYTTAPSVAPLC